MKTNVVLFPFSKEATFSTPGYVMGEGALLPFPDRTPGKFTPEMRNSLVAFALSTPGLHPIMFDLDRAGNEVCRMADYMVIGWDCGQCLFLSDVRSGFVDHGPFKNVDEICSLIAYIGA